MAASQLGPPLTWLRNEVVVVWSMSLAKLYSVDSSAPEWALRFKKIIDRVKGVEPLARVLVFGSFAERRFTAESDLDIAVILPDTWSEKEFLDNLYLAGSLSDWPLDIIAIKQQKYNAKKNIGGICFDINLSGIELYPKWTLNDTIES